MDTADLINLVEQTLISGATRTIVEQSIAVYCDENKISTPEQQAIDSAYAACVDRWIADSSLSLDSRAVYAWHERIRKHMMQMAMAADDYKSAHQIAADLAKLQQQYKREQSTADRKNSRAAILRSINGGR